MNAVQQEADGIDIGVDFAWLFAGIVVIVLIIAAVSAVAGLIYYLVRRGREERR